jgi:carbamoyl-phosphate synthase large subunit
MIGNILVTAAGGIVGQGLIKSLKLSNKCGNSSVAYNILGADMNPLAAGLYRCNTGIVVPPAQSPDYVEVIIDICKSKAIAGIFVGSDSELLILTAAKERIEKESGAKVLSGPLDAILIARDKWRTYEFCKANNIHCADSALPQDREHFVREFRFPIVVKPREGYGSVHFYVVHDVTHMEQAISAIEAEGWHPIIQRYLADANNDSSYKHIGNSSEFTTGITVDKTGQRVMSSISINKILKSGQTYKALIDDFPNVRRAAEAAALRLGSTGPVNIQAKLEGDLPVIFEINPRFSATCPMRAVAGVNEPDIVFRNVWNDEDLQVDNYRKLVCIRYVNEIFTSYSSYEHVINSKQIDREKNDSFIPDYF